jgi:hypothetical protein
MKVFTLAVAILALATVSAASGSTHARTAHNPQTFPDPSGDSGGGPDITSVLVGNTAAGLIRFEISIANTVLLSDNDVVVVFIDADRSPATGVFEGFEYTIQTAGSLGELVLARWDGSQFIRVASRSLVKVWESGGKMTLRISRSDLENTQGFSFFAATEVLPAEDPFDDTAPDGIATFTYTLSTPHIAAVRPSFAPATPRVGRAFKVASVRVALESDEVLPATTVLCRATLGGRALRGTGAGGCRFSLPRNARGKRLVVAITATVGDESRTLRTVFRVR